MAFCSKCGAQIPEGSKFCASCGAQAPETKNEDIKEKATAMFNDLNNTPDTTAAFDPADVNENKAISILSYLGFFLLIPLLLKPNSPFVRYHVNQGLILFIVDLAAGIVGSIFGLIPFVGWIVGLVLGIAVLALAIIGIVNCVGGKAKQLPIIGKYTILK